MYAVVAPGLKGVYYNYTEVERILALYPYTKFRKFRTEEECWAFINRNTTKRTFGVVNTYGDVFSNFYVTMSYFIQKDRILFSYDTSRVGYIRIEDPKLIIENGRDYINVIMNNIFLDNSTIMGHMIAIYQGVNTLGDFLDVNIIVPDHSVFYALNSYSGKNRIILKTRNYLKERTARYAVSVRRK